MPSNHQSCLLVKISSSQYGPACPPVIIKEKDGSRRAQQRHQHASLLCSERSTFSNPPGPDGPIYCTTWIVFGCTLHFQIFIWYPLSFLLPHRPVCLWFCPAHRITRTVWTFYGCYRTSEGLSWLRWKWRIMPSWYDTLQLQDLQTFPSLTLWFCFTLKNGRGGGVGAKKRAIFKQLLRLFPVGLNETQ